MDYQKGKIYKIESHLGDKIYIGSTTKEYLSQRMTAHRGDFSKWKQGKHNNVSSYELFEEYGIENCEIILLELYPCNSKDELSAKEAHYIKTLNCVNKVIPGRTQKQYVQDNKDKIKVRKMKYYQDNKDKIKEQQKKYDETHKERRTKPFNCECGCTIQLTDKARHQRTKKHMDLMTSKEN